MIVQLENQEEFYCGDGDSILDGALKAGLVLEYSCKNGQCGVCKAKVISGSVKELKPQLSLSEDDVEEKRCLTCCCAPATDISIDSKNLTALKGIVTKTVPVRINVIEKLSDEIIHVKLRYPPRTIFDFMEGQYLDVLLLDIRRSYSIASANDKSELSLLIKKVELGVMSNYWFNEAKENDLLRVEGPKGTFYLRDNLSPIIMLGTGTGIAPLISILAKLDSDASYIQSNPIKILWGNRCEKDFIWEPEFKSIKVDFYKVLSRPGSDWEGHIGYVQDIAEHICGLEIKDFDIYACGSNSMIKSAKEKFIKLGLPESKFYSDAFVQSY